MPLATSNSSRNGSSSVGSAVFAADLAAGVGGGTGKGSHSKVPGESRLGRWVRAQALNLSRHVAALRDFSRVEFGDVAEAPTEGHVLAVNQLLGRHRGRLTDAARLMNRLVAGAIRDPQPSRLRALLTHKHTAHAAVQHLERIWNFYFELFGQRQSRFGSWLLSTDRIALDCYQAAYLGVGRAKSIPAPPPLTYMQTGFGPATYRRGLKLRQLGREANPFPLIQLPYHRMINPWTLGAVLHEVSHNLQSDLGLSRAIPLAVGRRLLRSGLGSDIARIWVRWNRETFADLSGLLLGGPCIVASLMDVVGRSSEITYYFNPRGVHPTPYLRVLLSCELLRRMGFPTDADRDARAWLRLYPNPAEGGVPERLLASAPRAMALVVDTMCYQPYAALGGKKLSEVFRFAPKEQEMVVEAAGRLARGTDPGIVPARFLIGAARYALDQRLAPAETIKEGFYRELSRR